MARPVSGGENEAFLRGCFPTQMGLFRGCVVVVYSEEVGFCSRGRAEGKRGAAILGACLHRMYLVGEAVGKA